MTLRRHLAAAALALALATPALAQDFVFGFSPRTGDAFVDAQLGDINVYARGDTSGFIDDVVVSLGAPRANTLMSPSCASTNASPVRGLKPKTKSCARAGVASASASAAAARWRRRVMGNSGSAGDPRGHSAPGRVSG